MICSIICRRTKHGVNKETTPFSAPTTQPQYPVMPRGHSQSGRCGGENSVTEKCSATWQFLDATLARSWLWHSLDWHFVDFMKAGMYLGEYHVFPSNFVKNCGGAFPELLLMCARAWNLYIVRLLVTSMVCVEAQWSGATCQWKLESIFGSTCLGTNYVLHSIILHSLDLSLKCVYPACLTEPNDCTNRNASTDRIALLMEVDGKLICDVLMIM